MLSLEMKKIKSAALIGAGALGLMYMPSFQNVLGEKAFFLCGEDRYEKLNNSLFTINDKKKSFPIKKAGEISEKPDLILVAVKNYQLDDIAPLLKAAAGPETIIVSVLNGIESEIFLEKICPQSKVLYCAVLGMDAVKEGNSLSFSGMGKILVGSKENNPKDSALSLFTTLLEQAEMAYMIPKDIHRELWYKWMINIGINQVSAVTGASYGAFQRQKEIHDLMTDAMEETINVAKSAGVDLRKEDLENWEKVLQKLGPEGKTSMLQDMEACRKTEIESFAGKLIKMARHFDREVPVNVTLFRIIRTREMLFPKWN